MPLFALILLILFGLVILTGVTLALIARIWPVPHFNLRWLLPPPLRDDFFFLIRTLTGTDTLWHPGRGDLPNPSVEAPATEFPNLPME